MFSSPEHITAKNLIKMAVMILGRGVEAECLKRCIVIQGLMMAVTTVDIRVNNVDPRLEHHSDSLLRLLFIPCEE